MLVLLGADAPAPLVALALLASAGAVEAMAGLSRTAFRQASVDAGLARLAALDCDILLTPHPSASGMRDKVLASDWQSGMTCAAYAADRLAVLEERLAMEAAQ